MKRALLQWAFATWFAGLALAVTHVLGSANWVMDGYALSASAWIVIIATGALWATLYVLAGDRVEALSWSSWRMVKGTGPLALIVLFLTPITPGLDLIERFMFAAAMIVLLSALIWGDLIRPDDHTGAWYGSWIALGAGSLVHFGALIFMACLQYLPPNWHTDLVWRLSAGVALMGILFGLIGAGVVIWANL